MINQPFIFKETKIIEPEKPEYQSLFFGVTVGLETAGFIPSQVIEAWQNKDLIIDVSQFVELGYSFDSEGILDDAVVIYIDSNLMSKNQILYASDDREYLLNLSKRDLVFTQDKILISSALFDYATEYSNHMVQSGMFLESFNNQKNFLSEQYYYSDNGDDYNYLVFHIAIDSIDLNDVSRGQCFIACNTLAP